MMASTPQSSQEHLAHPHKNKSANKCLIFIPIAAVIIIFAIFYFGQTSIHSGKKHILYDVFESSQQHVKLLKKLKKNNLNILYGRKEEGLFNFVQHYANKLVMQGKRVFIENYQDKHYQIYEVVKNAKIQLAELISDRTLKGDWIITSAKGQIIPSSIVSKLRQQYPDSKILVATTTRKQMFSGFKEHQFPIIDQHQIEQSIQRNYNVSQNTADILFDFFQTKDQLFEVFDLEYFSQEQFLGQNYRSLEGLSKQDNRILKDLCKKGQGYSKLQSPKLRQIGVVFHEEQNYWKNAEARLNYQLHKTVNCKDKLISPLILQQIEEKKEREEEARKERQQQEQKKRLEIQQREKERLQNSRKKAETAKSTKKPKKVKK